MKITLDDLIRMIFCETVSCMYIFTFINLYFQLRNVIHPNFRDLKFKSFEIRLQAKYLPFLGTFKMYDVQFSISLFW